VFGLYVLKVFQSKVFEDYFYNLNQGLMSVEYREAYED